MIASTGSMNITPPPTPYFLDRSMYSLLNALPEGAEHVWSFLEKERFAKELEFDRERKGFLQDNKDLREGLLREREGFLRERESLREGFLREREGFSRERNFLIDREALAVATLQKQIDHSEGLITVRAMRLISNAVNNGSIHSTEVSSSPRLVIQDECTLLAIAAIFKFERRDVCFYVGGRSSLIKIPLPPHRSLVR